MVFLWLWETSKTEKEINDEVDPGKNSLTTFFSFFLFGSIPLLSYLLTVNLDVNSFYISVIFTGVSLLLLGFVKAVILDLNRFKTSLEMFLLGMTAAVIAYYIGELAVKLV